ncbi:hypothetical protein JIN77_01565 [Verrucomicrobiaceae bacterium R5-34]|nr:hypothetical protein [Verrucomicrobiaceae bacterium R5-34]
MSLPQVRSVSQSAERKLLRFGCPACGVRLVVDQSIAGVEGPCPSCGAKIVAPPAEVGRELVSKPASPLAVQPRQVPGQSAAAPEPDNQDTPKAKVEIDYPPSKRRSVSPNTVISEKHMETTNTLVFLKILAAVLIVALIVVAVYLALK